MKHFTLEHAPQDALAHERIAVIGYGNLGRAFALNLRDAGVPRLVVGNIDDDYRVAACADGMTVRSIADAVRGSDLAVLLLPDEVLPEVFPVEIGPHLRAGASVVFASGYNLAYGLTNPGKALDILMLAPRMGGETLRERFVQQKGFNAFISVEQDVTGKAWTRLLGLAHAVGALRNGCFELSARQEADLDLFIEQTLGAVIGFAVMNAFAVGVENGLPPEALALEMYMSGEMETVWRGFRTTGFRESATVHGPTAMYGGLMRTMQFFGTGLADRFQDIFKEIQAGQFAEMFQAEREAGYPTLRKAAQMNAYLDVIADAEAKLRRLRSEG